MVTTFGIVPLHAAKDAAKDAAFKTQHSTTFPLLLHSAL